MSEPEISVVVCTYNRAMSLRRALGTIADQNAFTNTSWELIVVDNNSTDNTHEVVQEFAKRIQVPFIYLFERAGKIIRVKYRYCRRARTDSCVH